MDDQRPDLFKLAAERRRSWMEVVVVIARRRALTSFGSIPWASSSSTALLHSVEAYHTLRNEEMNYATRRREIGMGSFECKFDSFTDLACLEMFRFRKRDVMRMILSCALHHAS